MHPRRRQRGHLLCRGALPTCNDRPCVAHPSTRGCGLAGDESHDRLLERLLNECGGFFLGGAADFANHDHGFRRTVVGEEAERVDE